MRKVQLLLVCLMLSAAAFAADKVIKLPKPNLNRTGAVMKALSERHSTREYASKALSLADLSDLLWAANGINRKESGMRTAPSALNKQDVDVYVVLPEGSYLYDAKNRIQAVPTFILFKNGEAVWRHSGVIHSSELQGVIEKHYS